MRIWAIADLHLAFSTPDKSMDLINPRWKDYAERIAKNWKERISPEDLVLIPGDISWAMRLEEALTDLEWIDKLPGKKIILKGNHDYWWSSTGKMSKVMPPSIQFIHNNTITMDGVTIGGTRLWDSEEYSFGSYIDFEPNPKARVKTIDVEEENKIFARELIRLEASLSQLDPNAALRIALTHYPPISADLKPSLASAILEKHKVHYCIFGHLHNLKKNMNMFGKKGDITYLLTSCDYLDFCPIEIARQS